MVGGWLVVFLNRDRKSLLRWTLAHCCSSVALNLSCLKRDVYVDSYVRWNVCNGETLELLICPRSLIGPPPYIATRLTNHIHACTDCDSNPVSAACFWALVASHWVKKDPQKSTQSRPAKERGQVNT